MTGYFVKWLVNSNKRQQKFDSYKKNTDSYKTTYRDITFGMAHDFGSKSSGFDF